MFRRFEDAAADHPDAERALAAIGRLYEVDRSADGDLDRLAALRRTESAAVLAELEDWLWQQAVLKSLSIGKAAAYTVANWERLTRFVDDPRVPLDDNATERAIRGPVTRGSLCVTPSSTWKSKRSLVRRIATRATSTVGACA